MAVVSGSSAGETLNGTSGQDTIYGFAGNDILYGRQDDDTLHGGADDDQLYGGAGNDLLDGGAGADTMRGDIGDDVYLVDDTGDHVIEGSSAGGTDLVQSSISFHLGAYLENLTLLGTGAINGIGNGLANTLIGNSGANVLDGLAGADVMKGAGGDDTYVVDNIGDQVIEGSATGGTDLVDSWVSFTLGANLENLTLLGTTAIDGTGNSLGNLITGNSAGNHLDGAGGADILYGKVGDDTLFGRTGDDQLFGGDGNDTLDGGTGADTMRGGPGDDTYVVDSSFDVVTEVSASEGRDLVEASVPYTLGRYIENLTLVGSAVSGTGNDQDNIITGNDLANDLDGAGGSDTLYGNGGDDVLRGGTEYDTLVGGTGNDTYYIDSVLDPVFENPGEGTDAVHVAIYDGTYTLAPNVEVGFADGIQSHSVTIYGNDEDNQLFGSDFLDVLSGFSGNDTIHGGGGGDELSGGAGNDLLFGEADGDSLDGERDNDTVQGNAGNDTVRGGDGDDDVQGNQGDDQVFGDAGNDTINGGAGIDQLTGGDGNDTFVFDHPGDSAPGAVDQILDFYSLSGEAAGDDQLDVSAIDADTNTPGDQPFAQGLNTPTANALWYDYHANGDGSGEITFYGDTNGDPTSIEVEIHLHLIGTFWFDDMTW